MPVGVPLEDVTVAVSLTEVPGATAPVELACVVSDVPPTTSKHSLVVVVDWDPVNDEESGV